MINMREEMLERLQGYLELIDIIKDCSVALGYPQKKIDSFINQLMRGLDDELHDWLDYTEEKTVNIGRMIEFNRMKVEHADRDGEPPDEGRPVWGVYESYDGNFNQLIVLDQAEAERLQAQINERLIVPAPAAEATEEPELPKIP